ncbi:hypothetical protein [Flavobacterium cerinum]|uniref:Lipoprotein n=1 Tax=Flavobacterium cerinum TaxID=2502784 RepID=A0ABY5IU18_9FLAO|nr:hypothetical protein [Flavobacterium cerinum]UUC45667.1 hypothetical protein NOX80_00290 [Flavobacterium cerinum]
MMGKIRFVLILAAALVMTSCNFTENVYINKDGSGKFALDIDASTMMSMMGGEGGEQSVDTTFTFKALLAQKKDSIAKLPLAEQERLKKMEGFSVRTNVDEKSKKFVLSLMGDFKKPSDLMDAMSLMKSMDDLQSKDGGRLSKLGDLNTDLKYAFDGKKFTRKVTIKDAVVQKQLSDSLATIKPMLETFTYTVKYHFPKKVKSVSVKDALFSEDRKTVTIQYPFADFIEKPEVMNFEAVLENK